MNRFCRLMMSACVAFVLLPGAVWAARPSGDTTRPADIDTLTVKTSALALTLRFTAPGDDGSTGTAAGYEVRYRPASAVACTDPVATNTPANWALAPRSAETIPETGGKLDFFNVRVLVQDTSYCLAIRARDEVPNYSAHWAVATGTTSDNQGVPSDWSLVTQTPTVPADANTSADSIHLAVVDAQPVLGWVLNQYAGGTYTRNAARFVGDGWFKQVSVASNISGNLRSFRMAGNPGFGAANPLVSTAVSAVVTGVDSQATFKVLLAEAGPTAPQSIVPSLVASGKSVSGGIDSGSATSLTYVNKPNGGVAVWNPVTSIQRIEVKTSTFKRTALSVMERVAGVWQETAVLRREGSDAGTIYFGSVEVFTKPDGFTLGFVAAHCGITVYAERDPLSGVWTYYDAGPALVRYKVSFDADGAVVMGQTNVYTVDPIVLLHRTAFQPRTPVTSCAVPNSTGAGPIEQVQVTPDPDMPSVITSGISVVGGATFIAAVAEDGNGKTTEQRLIYKCTAADLEWKVAAIDRTNWAVTNAEPVMDAQGNLLRAYSWSRFARAITQGPAYTVLPQDYVYLASHSGNYCGVAPAP